MQHISEIIEEKRIKLRLEYIRKELREERISYGELAELQDLIPHIDPGDVELLEAAGVPEQDPEDDYAHCVTCDRLINMDKDFWTVKGDNTFCDRCEVY